MSAGILCSQKLKYGSNYALRSMLVYLPNSHISVLGASKIFLESSFGSKKKLPLLHYLKQFNDILVGQTYLRALGIRSLLFFFSL